jgi:hypothetical protein
VQEGRCVTTVTDAISQAIKGVVAEAVREALNVSEATNRRLLSIAETAVFLCLSEREVHNMISSRELMAVTHGRRKMIDIRDLDLWIERNKG